MTPHPATSSFLLKGARLPQWVNPHTADKLVDIAVVNGKLEKIEAASTNPGALPIWDVQGALTLPLMVDAHTHLDKTLTKSRVNIPAAANINSRARIGAWRRRNVSGLGS